MEVISSTACNVSPLPIQLSEIIELAMDIFVHSIDTALTAADMSEKLGKSQLEILIVFIGALLHDIGKFNIDHKILNANRGLTAEERKQVDKHSMFGYHLLKNICDRDYLTEVISIVKHHHDYTRKCTDLEKIVQIADVYSALRENRPYRERFSKDEALDIVEEKFHENKNLINVLKTISEIDRRS